MNAVGGYKLPFGNLPRLLMAWLSTASGSSQTAAWRTRGLPPRAVPPSQLAPGPFEVHSKGSTLWCL